MKKLISFGIIILAAIFILGCTDNVAKNGSSEEKAMVTYITGDWYSDTSQQDGIFFTITLINYGFKEAKNVEVKCILYDWGQSEESTIRTPIVDITKNVGNVASTSENYKEITAIAKLNDDHYYSAWCFPISCDGCILLDERIPSLKEAQDNAHI